MVEVADEGQGRRGPSAGEQALRDRVQKLSDELEELERGHEKMCGIFRAAVAALAGMGPCELGRASAVAVVGLRKAAAAEPLDPAALEQAVAGLRTALMLEPDPKAGKGQEPDQAGEGSSDAAGHVALAIMEGLRLGEPEFDAHLEKAILEINRFIASGQVRPAMAVLTDLLDHYRYQHSRRWAAAESALKEVLDELLNTEGEVMSAVSEAQSQLSAASQQYEEQVTRSMGALVVDVSQSPDLETLKVKALEHIRGLRDHLRAHRSHEREVMAKSQGEITRLRENLSLTRQRMEQVERVSKVLSQEAMTDPLTKAWNKRALTARMEDDLANRAHWPVALIVFDIDHFKRVNDNFGHQAGDRALKAITQQAGQSLRGQDTLFRYAGDEFVILLRNTGLADAKQVAERVRQAAESIKFTYRGETELKITVSLGVAEVRAGESPEALFERADQALLGAKRAGRNRVGAG